MNNFPRKFFLLIKRQLKSKVFLCILLCVPLLSFLAHMTDSNNSSHINIVFYLEPSSDFNEKIASNLENYEGLFFFKQVDTEKELNKLVGNTYAECGYIFPNDLLSDLDKGKRRNRITQVSSPKTTMGKIVNEVVYAEIWREYALHLLQDLLYSKPDLESIPHDELTMRLDTLYRNSLLDGSTFSFQYFDTKNFTENTTISLFQQTYKGLLALLFSIGSLLGALTFFTDSENGLYYAVPLNQHFQNRFLTILTPTFLLSLVIYPSLLLTFSSRKWAVSLLFILLYCLLSTLLTTFFSILIPKKNIFASLIPIFIISSFICTPIFIDFSVFFPIFRFLRYFFLPYYFLLF